MTPTDGRRSTIARAAVGVTATCSLLVALGTAVGTARWIQLRGVGTDDEFRGTAPSTNPGPPPGPCTQEPCNYLVLGSDSRRGLPAEFGTEESVGSTARADTIMLIHTDPHSGEAVVLSFPRDLWVEIPRRGMARLNTAFEGGPRHGGPQLMAQTISDLTGLRVDHYVYVDLEGFQDLVETIGGVDMCIPAYNVNTPGWLPATAPNGEPTQVYVGDAGHIADPNAGLNIEPGCQRLSGEDALAYVRARHLPCDHIPDFARIGRQQQFLRALINQMLQPSQLVRAPSLVPEVVKHLRRDRALLPSDLVYLVGQLRGVGTGAVEFRAVPSVGAMVESKAVLKMEPSAERLFAALRRGGPIGDVGAVLQSTPPSEANTTVSVVDDGSRGASSDVQRVLSDGGFDIAPGIVTVEHGPGVRGPAIVFRPGAEAHAEVVSAYFPNLPVVGPRDVRGAHVAIVVTDDYEPVDPAETPQDRCPAPVG